MPTPSVSNICGAGYSDPFTHPVAMKTNPEDFLQTFSAVLHPWAAKLSLKSHLSKITLANILAGDTCDPISLSNLEGYLAFKEHSLENLQFIVWYQDYHKRFFELSETEQALSPVPCEYEFSRPNHASAEPNAWDSANNEIDIHISPRTDGVHVQNSSPTSILLRPILPPPRPALKKSLSPSAIAPSVTFAKVPRPLTHPMLLSGSSKMKSILSGNELQPYRQECMRIIATFLRPGAVKELPLDCVTRDTAIRNLAHTTHPEVFLPVYREMYNILEYTSVPGFLVHNSTLLNLPQQLFWLAFGVADILVGIAISLTLINTVPTPPHSRRAWRLFGCLFVSIGIMQLYSAFRGFCGRLYIRGRVQLRVWELQDVDEEAMDFWAQLLDLDDEPDEPEEDLGEDLEPLSCARDPLIYPPMSSTGHSSHQPRRCSYPILTSSARNGFHRPPVFGPDKVVQDPSIKALHRQVMNEIVFIGLVSAILFVAIVIPVPSLHH